MNNDSNALDFRGKKIFFLLPSAMIQNSIISELVQYEYEVYVAKNKDTLRRVLRKYPGSIVFVDLNEKMSEKEWETWVTAVMSAPDTKSTSVGVITAVDEEEQKKKYLQKIKVACGYTVVKFETDKAIKQIVEILQAAQAKGRRKYLRATTDGETSATINIPMEGAYVNGVIKDISVVGVSFTLEGNPEIAKNALVKDVQMILQRNRIKVEGILFGSREDSREKVYVLLFAQRTDDEVRSKIRKYVQHNMQIKMDVELQ